jgi:hypothetical protein
MDDRVTKLRASEEVPHALESEFESFSPPPPGIELACAKA